MAEVSQIHIQNQAAVYNSYSELSTYMIAQSEVRSKTYTQRTPPLLTPEDVETFLTSGTWFPKTRSWPSRTVLVATVKNRKGVTCYQKKHVYSCEDSYFDNLCNDNHAEVQFIEEFPEKFPNRRMKGTVELFCNYSPCRPCSQRLIDFQDTYPHLSITIKCAQLYKVNKSRNVSEKQARENRAGLFSLESEGIVIKTLSPDVKVRVAKRFLKLKALKLLLFYSGMGESHQK